MGGAVQPPKNKNAHPGEWASHRVDVNRSYMDPAVCTMAGMGLYLCGQMLRTEGEDQVRSFAHVFFPTMPSAVKPLALWKAFTAASVFAPKMPSVFPAA